VGVDTASAGFLYEPEVIHHCSSHLACLQFALIHGLCDAVLIIGPPNCEPWPITVVVDLLVFHLP
jgi:hypothetical protein